MRSGGGGRERVVVVVVVVNAQLATFGFLLVYSLVCLNTFSLKSNPSRRLKWRRFSITLILSNQEVFKVPFIIVFKGAPIETVLLAAGF